MGQCTLNKSLESIASCTAPVFAALGLSAITFSSVVNLQPVHAASASLFFRPTGAQIDDDPLPDILTIPGDTISFQTFLSPFGIGQQDVVTYSTQYDPQELELIGNPVPLSPQFGSVNVSNGNINVGNAFTFNEIIAGNNDPVPSFLFNFKVLPGLDNVPGADFGFLPNSAGGFNRGTGKDIREVFIQPTQMVEVQPPLVEVPEPLSIIGTGVALGFGVLFRRMSSKSLSEK